MTAIESFDYVVVGGGSAGCVVAARLAEEGDGSVLLLESGQSGYENPEVLSADGFKLAFANDATMWDRMSAPQADCGNRRIYAGSGKGLGGSGSVNGMVYTRGDRLDFEQWPANWQWDDVAPCFDALEQRLDIHRRGPSEFTTAAISAAQGVGFAQKDGLNDGDLCGYIGYNDMNYRDQERRSSYTAYIHGREAELPRLTIRTQCVAQRILFDQQRKAVAVEYLQDGVLHTANIGREIVLTAGAIETPKLLMVSGVGPRGELAKFGIPVVYESPAIGDNLQDHPSVCVFYKGKKPVDFHYPQVYGFHRVNPSLELPEGQADTCFVLLSLGSVLKYTLLRMVPIMALPGSLYRSRWLKAALRGLVRLVFKLPAANRYASKVYGLVVILGKPVSRGAVHLSSSDPAEPAVLDLAYYRDSRDMDTMIAGVQRVTQMAEQAGLRAWGNDLMSKTAESTDRHRVEKWIKSGTITVFHFSGTCAMGESDGSPVDTRLRVRGLGNVRVADASTIPVVPVSALNAPSMMIGYRAAGFILGEQATSGVQHSESAIPDSGRQEFTV
ncbi:GMC family oxidoreductase [Haliea sp. E17]|uniref:GMC family oxidoreductase n=1 Tax=Haliea sp. E17 TaxID=3401576 RepID=UPI003AAAF332